MQVRQLQNYSLLLWNWQQLDLLMVNKLHSNEKYFSNKLVFELVELLCKYDFGPNTKQLLQNVVHFSLRLIFEWVQSNVHTLLLKSQDCNVE